jgi:hypothetical protein
MYDRMVHFAFGLLLAYPVREVFMRVARARGFWSFFLPLDVTLAMSALYEIIEWQAAQGGGSGGRTRVPGGRLGCAEGHGAGRPRGRAGDGDRGAVELAIQSGVRAGGEGQPHHLSGRRTAGRVADREVAPRWIAWSPHRFGVIGRGCLILHRPIKDANPITWRLSPPSAASRHSASTAS